MPPTQNPFIVGRPVPPKNFVGRSLEVDGAFDQIVSHSHLAVYGSPGIGKSSFLQFVADPKVWQGKGLDPAQAAIVTLNCTGVNPFTPRAFWQEVLSLLKEKSEGDSSLQSDIKKILRQTTVEKSDLRRVLRKIGKKNRFLVLMLDDYDAALRPNDKYTEVEMLTFLSEFRNLAVHSEEGQYLSTIVTSFRRLSELGPQLTPSGSPWYNHYKFQPLKPFGEEDVIALISGMPAQWALTPEQRDGVQEIADGHPALLQNAGHLLYIPLRAGKPALGDPKEFTDDFVRATEQHFRDAWTFSTEPEQMLMMLIALSNLQGRLQTKRQYDLGDIDTIFSQWARELLDLMERGVVGRITQDGKERYVFASSIMEWWVVKEIENAKDEAEIQQREKVFVGMSRQQVQQVGRVMRQIWQHKEVVTSVVGWAGRLVTAFVKGIGGGAQP